MNGQPGLIKRFLEFQRIAVIGVSRNPSDFTRKIWVDFRRRGCDAIPVHPSQKEIDGVRCHKRVQDIAPAVEGALILVSRERSAEAVNDCVAAGVRTVWLYGIRGEKDVDRDVLKLGREGKIEIVTGHCPYMFFPEASFVHRFHGLIWKMVGYYPR